MGEEATRGLDVGVAQIQMLRHGHGSAVTGVQGGVSDWVVGMRGCS